MKIEKMVSRNDLMTNLNKAASYGKIEHLNKLSRYIGTNIELPNLAHNLILEQYEIKIADGNYQIVKRQTKYNADSGIWELIGEQVVEEIIIKELDTLLND